MISNLYFKCLNKNKSGTMKKYPWTFNFINNQTHQKMGLLELTRTLRKILMSSSIKIAISAKYIMAMNANKCDFMALLQ